jgi:methionyl aminopeptidase
MIPIKTAEEVELMRQSAQLVSKTLGVLADLIEPGISTLELDKVAYEYILDHGAKSGFLGLYSFPNTLCASPNAQVVHGIPTKSPLKEGDIISLDCGALLNGFYGDQAYTFSVGQISAEVKDLLRVTKESLILGIEQAKAGNRIGDISFAIQSHCENHGYGVVRELVGHGLGRKMHEKPEVPNNGKKGKGPLLKKGMVIAIEPMINLGTRRIHQLSDGWTILTADRKPSAHFEHDVAIGPAGPDILSSFKFVEEALRKKGALVI